MSLRYFTLKNEKAEIKLLFKDAIIIIPFPTSRMLKWLIKKNNNKTKTLSKEIFIIFCICIYLYGF